MKIAYIIKNKKGKFRPFVGTTVESDGDNDSFIYVIASGETTSELSEAQTFIKENDKGIDKLYLNPVSSSNIGATWLSELENANKA